MATKAAKRSRQNQVYEHQSAHDRFPPIASEGEGNIARVSEQRDKQQLWEGSVTHGSSSDSNHTVGPLSRIVRAIELEVESDRTQREDLHVIQQGLSELRALNARNEQCLQELLSSGRTAQASPIFMTNFSWQI